MNDDQLIIVCKGPPVCLLEDEAAVQAQKAGCKWCKRIWVRPDGTEAVADVSHA